MIDAEKLKVVKNIQFRKNLEKNIEVLEYLSKRTILTDLDKKAQSVFYKIVVIQIASIIESICFYQVINNLSSDGDTVSLGLKGLLKRSSFQSLLLACKELNIITNKEYNQGERIRKKRNSIHIQVIQQEIVFKFDDLKETLEFLDVILEK